LSGSELRAQVQPICQILKRRTGPTLFLLLLFLDLGPLGPANSLSQQVQTEIAQRDEIVAGGRVRTS
jgi:hypothetical protein